MFLSCFGILQRYVMGEVLRAFILALVSITFVIVAFMVMAGATRAGLAPLDVLQIVPYVMPNSLMFTLPASLLFAVNVVYGRLAADNEVTAIKSAGVSAFRIVWPALGLALILSCVLYYISGEFVPKCNYMVKQVAFQNTEKYIYKMLKKDRQLNMKELPFFISVKDVQDRVLIEPTFSHRLQEPEVATKAASRSDPNDPKYDFQIRASKASISFDLDSRIIRVHLVEATSLGLQSQAAVWIINNNVIELPLANSLAIAEPQKKVQEMTLTELNRQQAEYRKLVANERKRQVVNMAFWFSSGRLADFQWNGLHEAYGKYEAWKRRISELETEKQFRASVSAGPFFFVLLGAPIGILFARRDFLGAFMSCFLLIILIYYPATLWGVNVGKEGLINPVIALWSGNIALALFSGFALGKVRRH